MSACPATARPATALQPRAAAAALRHWLLTAATALSAAWAPAPAPAAELRVAPEAALPQRLRDTGLFKPGSATEVRPGVLPYAPQYPLWSDGAEKQRWLWLPAGRRIDARQPDAWQFPPGTRLWKEFVQDGRRIETRYIERRSDGRWLFASYVWNADGSDAVLAPAAGVPALSVPSRADCLACHASSATPVLGVSALQLSPDRDPQAAHGRPALPGDIDLPGLQARGWLQGLPARLLATPPRIAATSPLERAALGYLHGNCGHCHNRSGAQVPVRLTLAQSADDAAASREATLRSAVGASGRLRLAAAGAPALDTLIAAGSPHTSVLALRMQSRQPQLQMPPLGTQVPDPEGLALVTQWIAQAIPHPPPEEIQP
jgi:hypothetical protein